MRTIKETIAHIQKLSKEIEDGDPAARHKGPNCPGCLYELLEFIDSEPECRHDRLKEIDGRYYMDDNCCQEVYFCPDCGKDLREEA